MPSQYYPFYLQKRVTLDSAGAGQLQFKVGSTEEFEGEEIDFVVSSGVFNITEIRDQSGKAFTDANTSNPLQSVLFLTALDQRSNFHKFSTPLLLGPDFQFTISFSGGTGSATIVVTIKGKRRAL